MRTRVFALAAVLTAALAASLPARPAAAGEWRVEQPRDRFSGAFNVIARRAVRGHVLALRCLDGKRSLVLIDLGRPFNPADGVYPVRLRIDAGDIAGAPAVALDAETIEIEPRYAFWRELAGARELALRIVTPRMRFDRVVPLGRIDVVLALIARRCPLPE